MSDSSAIDSSGLDNSHLGQNISPPGLTPPDLTPPSLTSQEQHLQNTIDIPSPAMPSPHSIGQGFSAPSIAGPSIAGQTAPGLQQTQQDPMQALLSQLHDVKAPAPIEPWPPAFGWWVVCAAIIAALIALVFQGIKRRRTIVKAWHRNKYRKTALEELAVLKAEQDSGSSKDHVAAISAVLRLLKQTFFTAYPHSRDSVSQLHGSQWLEILAQYDPADEIRRIPKNTRDNIENFLYNPNVVEDEIVTVKHQLIEYAEHWIRKHKNTRFQHPSDTPITSSSLEVKRA